MIFLFNIIKKVIVFPLDKKYNIPIVITYFMMEKGE